ncbi:MAG: class A beta-lactamase [Bacteroidales bacterium]|nr:class A beta-lactamase [Bacteroidales bacterium]
MKLLRYFVITVLSVCITLIANPIKPQSLYESIDSLAKTKNLTLGISAWQGGKTFEYKDTVKFPLMSVFKLHVCLTALHKMQEENLTEKDSILIKRKQLQEDTYSPLLKDKIDKHFKMSYFDLIYYTLALSDNNTCDILIDYCGGIANVDNYICSLGITDFNLQETEATMHKDIDKSYNNWANPQSVNKLLKKITVEPLLDEFYRAILLDNMKLCRTGEDKIKAGLPKDVVIMHKTGSIPAINGNIIADNDAAIIQTKNGEWLYLTVFIKDSKESATTNAQVISQATEIVYGWFNE